ncbi:sugar ABC transporter permease [Acidipropionibacterium jensenii]|uniref:carbohydrate ABC transporter permease n=1 Tax=Acidipropionibacterium jensenii TaxID=1749 RepID=UPI000BC2DB10|nr:sugar ABC transporter permease [Acidipropionibacterium jensenii]AZZ42981.1 sugar ABC transporter permease [Acidipropionibacterium jensenii]
MSAASKAEARALAVVEASGQELRRHRKYEWREIALFAALILPNMTLIVVFAYWPTLYNLFLSFTDWDFVQPSATFVGLKKWQELFESSEFYTVLWNTLVFTLFTVIGTLIAGLGIALLLAQKLRFSAVVRTLTFAPHMIAGAVVGILFLFMFDPQYGISRMVFEWFGASSPQWTATSKWSLWAIIIAYSWQRVGFVTIIYYAAILDLPHDVMEAADVDGAHGWQKFRQMTFPLLRPVNYFMLITSIIASTQAFDIIATLTSGGPGYSSSTLTWSIYKKAFQEFDIGSSAAQSMVLFALLMVATIFQVKLSNRKDS